MKAPGNGRPEQCVLNLLRISRGEVPYDRIKGRDFGVIDAPVASASNEAVADAEWLLGAYEPRIDTDRIDIAGARSGDMNINAKVTVKRESEEA